MDHQPNRTTCSTFALETSDVYKTADRIWLMVGKLFPDATGFMITIQNQVTTTNNYKKHTLKALNIINDIRRKCQEKLATIPHITGAHNALAQGNYIHHHSQLANTVHQELAIKCRLTKGAPMPHYKHEPQFMLQNSNCKLCYDR